MAGNLGGYISPSVTAPVSPGSVVSGDIASGQILSGLIGNNVIVSGSIASGQIFTLHIASGGLLSGAIGSGQIGSFHIASGGILSGDIASGQIGTNHLISGIIPSITGIYGQAIATRTLSGLSVANSGLLFTTTAPGIYQFTSYIVIPQGGLLNAGNANVLISWTDESQLQSGTIINGIALLTSGDFGQGSTVIRCASGTNVFMTVTLSSLTGNPVYNAYGALQKIM